MKFEELFVTKCEKDYRNRHFWESIGVTGIRPIYRVWHCTQCDRCITEELKMLVSIIPIKKKGEKENI